MQISTLNFLIIYLSFFEAKSFGAELVTDASDECIELVSRADWSAELPRNVHYQTFPVKNVVIAHTVTPTCETFSDCSNIVRNIQSYHKRERDFSDIAYNFLVGNDGNVYEGVGWHKIGTHTRGHNNGSIGIAFIGNFNEEDQLPADKALEEAQKLLRCGVATGELDPEYRLFGHRQLQSTQSPGSELMRELRSWEHWCANP